MNNKSLKFVRLIIFGFSILVVIFLFFQDLAWLGEISFKTDFLRFKPLISILTPEERVNFLGSNVYIEEEPVYFDIYPPRDFDKVNLEFTYQSFTEIMEIGALINENSWQLKAFDNQILNKLNWLKLEDQGLVLWQRNPDYGSIGDFLNNLPEFDQIATYKYDLLENYTLPDYQPSRELKNFSYKLQGGYSFFTYIEDEDLYFEFDLFLPDDSAEAQFAKVVVSDLSKNIWEVFYWQPGNDDKIIAELADLPRGVYRLDFETSSDKIETENISSKQKHISFIDKLQVLEANNLWTNAHEIKLTAYETKGIQSVTINDQLLDINEIYKPYNFIAEKKINSIKLDSGYLEIAGRGVFAFDQQQYLNPLPVSITPSINLDKQGINYVIADYNLPRQQDNFKINSVEFDLNAQHWQDGKVRFIISAPSIDSSTEGILIKNLKVKLLRQPVWQAGLFGNIKNYLKYYRNEIE